MEKLLMFINSIDWIFAAVILVGGRYWGGKYFTISKNPSHNFLAFASAFGVVWIAILYLTVGVTSGQVGSLFITYLFTTSFYELLAKKLFELVEGLFDKGQAKGGGKGGDTPPPPPTP